MLTRIDFMEVHLQLQAVGERLRETEGASVTHNSLSRSTLAVHIIDVHLGSHCYMVVQAYQLELGRFGIRAHHYRGGNQPDLLHTWDITSAHHYTVELDEIYDCIRCAQDCSADTCPATAPHATMELDQIGVELTSWCQQALLELLATTA